MCFRQPSRKFSSPGARSGGTRERSERDGITHFLESGVSMSSNDRLFSQKSARRSATAPRKGHGEKGQSGMFHLPRDFQPTVTGIAIDITRLPLFRRTDFSTNLGEVVNRESIWSPAIHCHADAWYCHRSVETGTRSLAFVKLPIVASIYAVGHPLDPLRKEGQVSLAKHPNL